MVSFISFCTYSDSFNIHFILDDFLCAINAAKKAEYNSDINSEDEKKVKFPSRKIQSSSSEEKDNDYVKGSKF